MYKLLALFAVLAAVSAAPAPKPVVVLPPVYHPPVLPHPVYPAPLHYPAPVAVSHVSTLLNHPPVLPYSPYTPYRLPAVLPASPLLPPLY